MSITSALMVPIFEQPNLLWEIFSFLESPKELISVGSVNKLFNKIAKENVFWIKVAEKINYLTVISKDVYLHVRTFIKEVKKEIRCCRFLPKNEVLNSIIDDSNPPTIHEIQYLEKYRTTMDIIAVWKSLAFSAGLIKPAFDHIKTVEDLFKKADQFSQWFKKNKEELYQLPHYPSVVLRYGIRRVPKKIWRMNKLKLLDFMNDKLRTVAGIEQLTNLKCLSLANNRFVSIKEILPLTQLKHLYLDGNRITSIDGIEKLTQLRTLILDNNLLETIPLEIEQLPHLKTFSYKNNPIKKSSAESLV